MNPIRPRQIAALAACVLIATIIGSCGGRRCQDQTVRPAYPSPSWDYEGKTVGAAYDAAPADGTPDVRKTGQESEAPLLARDLGDGAGGEKLGHCQPGDRDDHDVSVRTNDNPFVRADQRGGDASTFSTDVDTASYTMLRSSLIDQRRLPAPESVRIEEMLNSFRYEYPRPTAQDEHPFRIATDSVACPWSPGHRVVRIGIAGREMDRAHRPPANLVFLIDTSGSMSPDNRLPLLVRTNL